MSSREIVMDLLAKLPEDVPLEEIARKIEFLAGLRTALEQAERREGTPAEEVRMRLGEWVGR